MPSEPPTSSPAASATLLNVVVDDLVQTLSFALRYQGRRRVDTGAEAMARITAQRLVEHLRVAGYVVMRKPAKPSGPDRHYGPSAREAANRQP